MASLVSATETVPAASPAAKTSPRRTSNVSQASSRQSFASEYSYRDSDGETPLKAAYNEDDALAAALKESEQEEAFDRLQKGDAASFGRAPRSVESLMVGCAGVGLAASTPKH